MPISEETRKKILTDGTKKKQTALNLNLSTAIFGNSDSTEEISRIQTYIVDLMKQVSQDVETKFRETTDIGMLKKLEAEYSKLESELEISFVRLGVAEEKKRRIEKETVALKARAIAAERSLDEIKFGKPTSFSTALFKTRYENVETPKQQYQVMAAVHQLISRYCEETGIPKSEGDKFFEELQAEAFSNKHELLKEVPSACLRLWTSAKQLRQREFCSILNEMIRADNKYVMDEVTMISRGINSLCATRNSEDKRLVEWPADHILFRGSGLPEDKQEFFIPGTKYRCPMYLATSKNMMVSKKTFCARAAELGLPPVLWIIHLDPKYGCVHVNFVDRTNIPGEQEFLFVPYSTFEVLSADFKDQPTWLEPHVIHIRAEIDNKLCSDDLPLSPWH